MPVFANSSTCHGAWVNPITDICWSCLFPISIGKTQIVSSDVKDNSANPDDFVCTCTGPNRIGLTLGFWEPTAIVDITRTPFCLVNLGGIQLKVGHYGMGTNQNSPQGPNGSFYYVHWYRYPLLYWLNLIIDGLCVDQGDLDLAYITELDPTWHDDELAFLLNPEAIFFGNPIAQFSCAADSIAASLGKGPIDKLFWCAGAQGSMYPLFGQVQNHIGGAQAGLLLVERMALKLHREGLADDSVGEIPGICQTVHSVFLPKSRYRYQMVNPYPTTGRGGCYPFGASTAFWESEHEYPVKGEDFGYLVWRKRNCCVGITLPG